MLFVVYLALLVWIVLFKLELPHVGLGELRVVKLVPFVSDGMNGAVGTVRIPIPEKRAVRVESQMAWDSKVVAADLGYFFASAVS